MNLIELKKKIPHQRKIQSYNKAKTRATCVAYIDARDVMLLLDSVVGPSNWQDRRYQVKNTMCCDIGIKFDDGWVWKGDGGAESAIEKEKGEVSDAFKRAGVKWGIGGFLYDLEVKYIDIKDKRPIDKNGNIIYNLTEYFEGDYISILKKYISSLGAKNTKDADEILHNLKGGELLSISSITNQDAKNILFNL